MAISQKVRVGGTVTPQVKEIIGSGAITPGDAVLLHPSGFCIRHPAAIAEQNTGAVKIATRNQIGGDIDTDYADGDTISYYVGRSGERFHMWLADGESAMLGNRLMFAANGELAVHIGTAGIHTPAIALEAVDNSSGGAKAQILVELR